MQYSETIRRFSLSLHFQSPRAYRYIRNKFAKRLPAPSTIRKWFSFCNADSSSGICAESMAALCNLADEMKNDGKDLICSLAFDEMHIKSHLEWIHEKKAFSGLITYGERENVNMRLAKQAIVFLITSIELKISLPVAHFFIDNLNAQEKQNMLLDMIRCLWAIGINILTITFDGLITNRSMCEKLGACFQPPNIQPFIEVDNKQILILLDPPHMLKNVRNSFASKGQFLKDGSLIMWRYIERLENKRIKNNFVAHKLTKEHIQWDKNKMNVRLAAQTFSKSVSCALNHLKNERDLLFLHSGATSEFLQIFNDLFDIFNAKHRDSNVTFRQGLSSENSDEIFRFLDIASNYITSLKIGTKKVVDSNVKCGFIGFLTNIETLKIIYSQYVQTGRIKVLLTFYLGQDLLESLFGRIRAMHGRNDNPNPSQFSASFRAVVIHTEITASEFANCKDALNILSIPSTAKPPNSVIQPMEPMEPINNRSNHSEESELDENVPYIELDPENEEPILPQEQFLKYEIHTVAYFAGQIEKKIQNGRFQCEDGICSNIFVSNEKIDGNFFEGNQFSQRPCKSTLTICEIVHKHFTSHSRNSNFNYKTLLSEIQKEVPFNYLFPQTNFTHDIGHKVFFINYIIDEYVRLYATYLAKRVTLDHHKLLERKSLHKKIHEMNL